MIKTKNEQTEQAKTTFNVEVLRAREIKKEDNQQVIAFDIKVNGITIYGMIYRSGVSANTGNEYETIAFPARKGTDNTYYNHVWFPISKDLSAAIIEQIASKLTA